MTEKELKNRKEMIGTNIKKLRQELNITATALASYLGKGESAVRMWELGRSMPDPATLIDIATFFNCTTDYLLGLSKYKNNEQKNTSNSIEDELIIELNNLSTELKIDLIQQLNLILKSVESTTPNYQNELASLLIDLLRWYGHMYEYGCLMINEKDALAFLFIHFIEISEITIEKIKDYKETILNIVLQETDDRTIIDEIMGETYRLRPIKELIEKYPPPPPRNHK